MTYLVLARKWRPRSFDTLVGQDHVVRALTHALDTQRLHHAWLFTGTRGVGKTTLSRILAKSLNCEQGVTAQPCGQCRACTEIDAGRYVDYVELDAASNRGVDEMTQLLEQAVYAPSSARFKVYMIDEVHMLTGHAFNAMLKTLEEPPPHVKFILATTDPQKIPVTVLSRCLQFNLKHMTVDAIVAHLQTVLGDEGLAFESPALRLLGQAAGGSMRDALSLTDQAIAYSAGNLTLEAVQGMLGTIDQRHLVRLLRALAVGQAGGMLAVADELAARGLSYAGALADLAVLLSHIAIEQRVPGALPADDPLAPDVEALAAALHPDLVQLYYSVAVHSRSELSLAPDEYAGFVMACLRMLALTPESAHLPEPPAPGPKARLAGATDASVPAAAASSTPGGGAAGSAATTDSAPGTSVPATTSAVDAAPQPVRKEPIEPAAAPSPAGDDAAASASEAFSRSPQAAGPGSPDVPAWEALPDETAAWETAAAASLAAEPADSAQIAEIARPTEIAEPTEAPEPIEAAKPIEAANRIEASQPAESPEPSQASQPAESPEPAQAPQPSQAPEPAHAAEPIQASEAAGSAGRPAPEANAADAVKPIPADELADVSAAVPVDTTDTTAVAGAPVLPTVPPELETPPDDAVPAMPDDFSGFDIPDDAGGDWEPVMDDGDPDHAGLGVADLDVNLGAAGLAPLPREAPAATRRTPRLARMTAQEWPGLAASLPLTGLADELARQSEWVGVEGDCITLRVAIRSLAAQQGQARLRTVLTEHFGKVVQLKVEFGVTGAGTARALEQVRWAERQKEAESAVANDVFVLSLIEEFGARVMPGSIAALDDERAA